MLTLFHFPLFAGCRFVRLSFAEYGEELALIEEKPWTRRREFLSLNPAGTLPVLLAEGDVPVVGAAAGAGYGDETRGGFKPGKPLLAEGSFARAQSRRPVGWDLVQAGAGGTAHLRRGPGAKPQMTDGNGGSPDAGVIRAARANIRQHLKYTNWLAATRNWLAGPRLTYADMAAAATLSVLDYLGEIDWGEHRAAREWYQRMKSRPSFRPLLQDRVRGLSPVSHYAALDF